MSRLPFALQKPLVWHMGVGRVEYMSVHNTEVRIWEYMQGILGGVYTGCGYMCGHMGGVCVDLGMDVSHVSIYIASWVKYMPMVVDLGVEGGLWM
jgi:hypothetical protein